MNELDQEYVVCGTLLHDGKAYTDGTRLPPGFFTDAEQVAAARFYGAIKLPAEVLPAADLQAQLSAKDAEVQSLREKLAQLEAAKTEESATFQPGSETETA